MRLFRRVSAQLADLSCSDLLGWHATAGWLQCQQHLLLLTSRLIRNDIFLAGDRWSLGVLKRWWCVWTTSNYCVVLVGKYEQVFVEGLRVLKNGLACRHISASRRDHHLHGFGASKLALVKAMFGGRWRFFVEQVPIWICFLYLYHQITSFLVLLRWKRLKVISSLNRAWLLLDLVVLVVVYDSWKHHLLVDFSFTCNILRRAWCHRRRHSYLFSGRSLLDNVFLESLLWISTSGLCQQSRRWCPSKSFFCNSYRATCRYCEQTISWLWQVCI